MSIQARCTCLDLADPQYPDARCPRHGLGTGIEGVGVLIAATKPADIVGHKSETVTTWQPIETAPKDGTEILLGRFVDKCQFGHNNTVAVDYWHDVTRKDKFNGFGQFNPTYWPPTHWMPIPAPPEPIR